jgi:membrane protein DedA with SNARE-associated domain
MRDLRAALLAAMLARTMQGFVSHWGYIAIAIGAFVEGEAVLLWAGALTHSGHLALPLVILAATVGSLAWGQTWFYVGRTWGRTFVDRRASWHERSLRVEHWLVQYGSWVVVGFRFVAGMAIVLPALIGACGYRPRRFLVLDAIGAVSWASLFTFAGFGMGATLEAFLKRPLGWPELIGMCAFGVLLVWSLARLISGLLGRARTQGRETPADA